MNLEESTPIAVGWREWVRLPDLGIKRIKAKIDTGARTSAIHTEKIEVFHDSRGVLKVRFTVLPLQNTKKRQRCIAEVIDRRIISDSGGHRELRWVIRSMLEVGGLSWPIELTLTNRENMRFRMLLGRTALQACCIFPTKSYLASPSISKKIRKK